MKEPPKTFLKVKNMMKNRQKIFEFSSNKS